MSGVLSVDTRSNVPMFMTTRRDNDDRQQQDGDDNDDDFPITYMIDGRPPKAQEKKPHYFFVGDDDDHDHDPYAASSTSARPARSRPGTSSMFARDPAPAPERYSSRAALFPTWRCDEESYLVKMADRSGEGLLIDPGSPENLVGSRWSGRLAAMAAKAGQPAPTHVKISPFTVGGVGKTPQRCEHAVRHSIAFDDGAKGIFEAPELPDSDVPALLGLRALDRHRTLLDVRNMRLYFVGEGGYKLQLSPGSRMLLLVRATTGHLILPCSTYEQKGSGRRWAFPVEEE